tara:strand:+ start:1328 stop:2104 length:777 start_codon:yes stop_codon:yes gene_type:complete
MNFFFHIHNQEYNSRVSIPKFNNFSKYGKNLKLFKLLIKNQKWFVERPNYEENKEFFFIESHKNYNNSEGIYFIGFSKNYNEVDNKFKNKLVDFENFTNTDPEFRSNLRVMNKGGGFSSYQSEYPFSMTTKQGSILSSTSSLTNKDSEKNILFFVNIFAKPVKEKFSIYFVNYEKKEIVSKREAITNEVNFYRLEKEEIDKDIFLYSQNFLGIPIFLSEKNCHISMEHTHPPHEYVHSNDRFTLINNLKDEFNKIINS